MAIAQPDRGMDEFADPGGPNESALSAGAAGAVLVSDRAQDGEMPAGVVFAAGSESEAGQEECGVEVGRSRVLQ